MLADGDDIDEEIDADLQPHDAEPWAPCKQLKARHRRAEAGRPEEQPMGRPSASVSEEHGPR